MPIGYNNKQRQQTEFCQCAIFYGVPIAGELDNYTNPKKVPKALREELENQKFVFPFYSQEIFPDRRSAELFLPGFVRDLISKGFLPKEVLDENNILNENMCKAATVPLKLSFIENAADEPLAKS